MKQLYFQLLLLFPVIILLNACTNNDSFHKDFDNRVYIDVSSIEDINPVRGYVDSVMTKSLRCAVAKPTDKEIEITYNIVPSLVDIYNEKNKTVANLLPEEYYTFENEQTIISVDSARSTETTLFFHDLEKLNPDEDYVLPLQISNATNIDILESGRTIYYVFRLRSVIEVVADGEENAFFVTWTKPEVVQHLTAFTWEALFYCRDFNYDVISTVMGIEGYFLIRIGDAGIPKNTLQISSMNGNCNINSQLLPTHQWIHVAVTFYAPTNHLCVYLDGELVADREHWINGPEEYDFTTKLLTGGFAIGYSCNEERSLHGLFSECRMWNILRTPQEIKENVYYVDPHSEGLIAYWKFNDGLGNTITDHSGNRNHALAQKEIIWHKVSLPETQE